MTDKVLCPWCGAEMRMEVYNDCAFTGGRILGAAWRAFYRCHLCGAQGPEETRSAGNKAEEAARAAALRRYTPPITAETKLVCPINAAPCSECKPGSPCGVEVMKDA